MTPIDLLLWAGAFLVASVPVGIGVLHRADCSGDAEVNRRKLKVCADRERLELSRVIDLDSGDLIDGVCQIAYTYDGDNRAVVVLTFLADMVEFEAGGPPVPLPGYFIPPPALICPKCGRAAGLSKKRTAPGEPIMAACAPCHYQWIDTGNFPL